MTDPRQSPLPVTPTTYSCLPTEHDYQRMVVERKKQNGDWFINRPKLDIERAVIVCTKCGSKLNV